MGGPMDGIWRGFNEEWDDRQQRQWYPAKVVSITGTQVRVRRLGAVSTAEIEGPFPTKRGVIAGMRVGDQVIVDWRYGSPVIDLPVESGSLRSTLNVIAEDLRIQQTTEPTTWTTLLEVDNLGIPADMPFWVESAAEVLIEGSAGAAEKQIRLLYNEGEAENILNLTSAANGFTFPLYLTAFVPWDGATPSRGFMMMGLEGAASSFVQDVDRIRLQAKTNDSEQGNDIVKVFGLVVRT